MKTLIDYIALADLTVEAFEERFSCPFLIRPAGEDALDAAGMFNTRSAEGSAADFATVDEDVLCFVAEVRKGGTSPFLDRIFVGRAARSDVQIENGGVSKSHAYFQQDVQTGAYTLTDTHSTNGTSINDVPLEPGRATPVAFGDFIGFGGFVMQLVEPRAVWELLRG